MSVVLANVTTGDGYTAGATLSQPRSEQALVQIANAAVFYQLDLDEDGHGLWEQEERFVLPSIGSLSRRCGGIRFRSAVAGSPAQVSCELLTPDDVVGGDQLAPFTGFVRPSGAVGQALNVPTLALASFPPTNPTEGDTYMLILPASFDPIGGKPVRWLVQFDASNGLWHVQGPPLFNVIVTSETRNNGAYGDLTTLGPDLTVPRAGDYQVTVGCTAIPNVAGAAAGWMAPAIGGAAASDNDAAISSATAANDPNINTAQAPREKTGLLTNDLIRPKYRITGAGTVAFSRRIAQLTPLRIT
jgi:hypothetical protein